MNQDPREAFERQCKAIGIDGSALERWEEGCENPDLAGQYMRQHVQLMWQAYQWRDVDAAKPASGQCRFKDEKEWRWCEPEHVDRVLSDPRYAAEGYEVRYLYAEPQPNAALADGWMPIKTAPRGAKGYAWMRLAWGPDGDQCTGSGMRWGDKFFAVATFHALGQEQRYELRVIEVQPTHWSEEPAPPTLNASKEG